MGTTEWSNADNLCLHPLFDITFDSQNYSESIDTRLLYLSEKFIIFLRFLYRYFDSTKSKESNDIRQLKWKICKIICKNMTFWTVLSVFPKLYLILTLQFLLANSGILVKGKKFGTNSTFGVDKSKGITADTDLNLGNDTVHVSS